MKIVNNGLIQDDVANKHIQTFGIDSVTADKIIAECKAKIDGKADTCTKSFKFLLCIRPSDELRSKKFKGKSIAFNKYIL
jgi:hypothetical protein